MIYIKEKTVKLTKLVEQYKHKFFLQNSSVGALKCEAVCTEKVTGSAMLATDTSRFGVKLKPHQILSDKLWLCVLARSRWQQVCGH